MNTVAVNFNTALRQMTEMFQWPICHGINPSWSMWMQW